MWIDEFMTVRWLTGQLDGWIKGIGGWMDRVRDKKNSWMIDRENNDMDRRVHDQMDSWMDK